MRVMGLHLHLWCQEVFKKLGDSCGGFIAVDQESTHLQHLQWVRVLLRSDGRRMPGFEGGGGLVLLHHSIVVGSTTMDFSQEVSKQCVFWFRD